jgi:hypothetical protein
MNGSPRSLHARVTQDWDEGAPVRLKISSGGSREESAGEAPRGSGRGIGYRGGETRICQVPGDISYFELMHHLIETKGYGDCSVKYEDSLDVASSDPVSMSSQEDLECALDGHRSSGGPYLRLFVERSGSSELFLADEFDDDAIALAVPGSGGGGTYSPSPRSDWWDSAESNRAEDDGMEEVLDEIERLASPAAGTCAGAGSSTELARTGSAVSVASSSASSAVPEPEGAEDGGDDGGVDISAKELSNLRPLDRGGFGQVWKAVWRETDVAVKALYSELHGGGQDALREFRREISVLARLRHPNIVLYLGTVRERVVSDEGSTSRERLQLVSASAAVSSSSEATTASQLSARARGAPLALAPACLPAQVTEFVPRGSLCLVIRKATPARFTWRRRLEIAIGIATGMHYLHSQAPPIAHLDLKSPNVLITGDYTAKVSCHPRSCGTRGSRAPPRR